MADEVETVDGIPDILAILRTPGIFCTMNGWIGVILTRRMNLMLISRRTGRPSRLFLVVRP